MENEYLYRKIDDQLLAWSRENKRKPLLVRGARQVGKSSAIRNLARHFEYFVEVNFDQQKEVCTLFERGISPQEICENLSLIYNTPISRVKRFYSLMKSRRALRLFLPCGISMKNIPIYTWLLPGHSLNLHWKNCLHSGWAGYVPYLCIRFHLKNS